jgi:hypothetical protein
MVVTDDHTKDARNNSGALPRSPSKSATSTASESHAPSEDISDIDGATNADYENMQQTGDGDGGYFIGDEEMQDVSSATCGDDTNQEEDYSDPSKASKGNQRDKADADFHIAARPPESVAPTSATLAGGAIAGLRNFRMHLTASMAGNSSSDGQSSNANINTHAASFSSPISTSSGSGKIPQQVKAVDGLNLNNGNKKRPPETAS